MRVVIAAVAALGISGAAMGQAPDARRPEPTTVGTCVFTSVARVTTRLTNDRGDPVRGSGSAVVFANGLYQGGHDTVRAIEESRIGDRAFVCLVAEDPNCPAGSEGVQTFTTTNLRTLRSWTRANSSRGC